MARARCFLNLLVINLGTNDFAHENPAQEHFVSTYVNFVRSLHAYYPTSRFVLLSGPMMTDGNSRASLSRLKQDLKLIQTRLQENANIDVSIFHLRTQGALGHGCAWHPNLAQHALNGKELSLFLSELMQWKRME